MRKVLLAMLLGVAAGGAAAYPIDGYDYTGIRRLEQARLVQAGAIPGRRKLAGQRLGLAQVQPDWHGSDGTTLPPPDEALGRALAALVPEAQRADYAMALLDLSDAQHPTYAAWQGNARANVGSVGKILVALALFEQLADLYPDDLAARERVLRDTRVTADAFSQHDHHVVPFFDVARRQGSSRSIRIGDEASLWEYLDWMLSASSNSAAGMAQKELLALAHFGRRYPVPADEEAAFFARTSRAELGRLMARVMDDAAARNGLDPARIRQGGFFTAGGGARVAGRNSYATPEQLVKFLFRLDAGTLVDAFSSREIKRLLYMTQRRIRYASHPALDGAAVYFKSGSFFECLAPGSCGKYRGDRINRLASVAIIESPAGAAREHYLVAVMSNVLRVNSAVAHQTLALRVQRLVESRHAAGTLPPEPAYPAVPVDGPDAGPADAP